MLAMFTGKRSSADMLKTRSFVFFSVVETVGVGWRGLAGNLFCVPFAFGYMMLPGFAYLFREWRHLQLVLSAPGILLLVTWWFLPESPRWLLRKGRVDEADQVLRNVAQVNGKESTLPDNFKDLIARIAAVVSFNTRRGEISFHM